MTKAYDVQIAGPAAAAPAAPALRRAGLLCTVGAVVAAVGATVEASVPGSVSADRVSYPVGPTTFQVTEVVWTITHLLTLVGAIGLARSGLVGRSRTGRAGLRTTLAGMALLVPAELAFTTVAHQTMDSTPAVALSTVIGLAATLAGVGFTITGIATLREHVWTGSGRWTPLLCGLFVILVLLPVQAVRPSVFLWPIAGWNVCLALLGVALIAARPPATDPLPGR